MVVNQLTGEVLTAAATKVHDRPKSAIIIIAAQSKPSKHNHAEEPQCTVMRCISCAWKLACPSDCGGSSRLGLCALRQYGEAEKREVLSYRSSQANLSHKLSLSPS